MKLPIHYVVNDAMRPLAENYLLPSIPSGFAAVEHKVDIHTSGNFLEDNFLDVRHERTWLIIDQIRHQPDNGLMVWCDVDTMFFTDCVEELKQLAQGFDLLFQREHNWDRCVNWGLQIIRRNKKTLSFYIRLLQMQLANEKEIEQVLGNKLLHSDSAVDWELLPLHYSSESNGGCGFRSVFYHANCTAGDSVRKKRSQLDAASSKKEQAFEGFKCKKAGKLECEYFRGYETRNESTAEIIKQAVAKYGIQDFDWFYVYTGDQEPPDNMFGKKVYCYATHLGSYDRVCPDFTFNHWRETQMDDYEKTRAEISEAGDRPPEMDMIGWRGNVTTHPSRMNILKFNDDVYFDVDPIVWSVKNPNRLTCHNFFSLPDQVRRWRYLLDVEGVGWSARLKLFFFSKRVVFLQERPFKEWYFPYLKPWEHYVPVLRDLSDLKEKLELIKKDMSLENHIRNGAFRFAQKHLTREAALTRWKDLLA